MEQDKPRILPRDRDFFLAFYEANKGLMYYCARRYTNHREECDDIVQDTLLRLMANIPTLRRLDRYRAAKYISLTTKCVYLDRQKRDRLQTVPILDDYSDELESVHRMEESLSARLDTEYLKEELSPREWTLLEGKYIAEYSQEELAGLLDCSPDSIRMMLSRARKKARTVIENRLKEGSDVNGF